jgi:hypothetical protein
MLGHFCGHIIKGHTLSSTLDQVGEYIRQKQDDSISAALFMEIGVNWAVFRSKVLSWDFIAPEQRVKWSQVDKKFKAAAVDADGRFYAYVDIPKRGRVMWEGKIGEGTQLLLGTVHPGVWYKTLQIRP